MAPIVSVSASSDAEDHILNRGTIGLSKENSDVMCTGTGSPASVALSWEGRDDVPNAAGLRDGLDDVLLEGSPDANRGRRESKLFADVNAFTTVHLGDDDPTSPPSLSLMQSCSYDSPSSSPGAGLALEESDAYGFDDFATGIMSQIDADEALARQLQEEENGKKTQTKPKKKVLPSVADSLFGAPSPWEVKSQYTTVSKGSSNQMPDSISGGISMLTNSFRKLGDDISTAATDFFGEDVGMQVRSPTRRNQSQYRNEV